MNSAQEKAPQITGKTIAKYAMLPGIMPRLKRLGFIFQKLLFVFVQIFGAVGLIDRQHPCLRPENMGNYHFGHIVAYVWGNLEFKKENTPKIVMFFAVMLGLLITIGIIVTGFAALFTNVSSVAHAQYFSTPKTGIPYDPSHDWMFQFLERVFGGKAVTGLDFWVPGDAGLGGNLWYVHLLVGMLKLYSKALLFIALIIMLYIVVMALADSARTGKPFGKSFDSVWTPIRFAIAIGLLVPISGSGYNGGQLIVFQVAEWGSNLATNMWHRALLELKNCDDSSSRCNFITTTVDDKGYKFIRDMYLINLCYYGYETILAQGNIKDASGHMQWYTSSTSTDTTYNLGTEESNDFCGTVVIPKPGPIPADYTRSTSSGASRNAANYLPNKIISGYSAAAFHFLPNGGNNLMHNAATKMTENAFCKREENPMLVKCDASGTLCNEEIKKWIYDYWKTALAADPAAGMPFWSGYRSEIAEYNSWIVDTLQQDANHGWAAAGVFFLRMSYSMSEIEKGLSAKPYVSKLPANFVKTHATTREPGIQTEDVRDRCSGLFSGLDADCNMYLVAESLSNVLRKGNTWFSTAPISDPPFYSLLGAADYDMALKLPEDETAVNSEPDLVVNSIMNSLYEKFNIGSDTLNPLATVIGWGHALLNASGIAYGIATLSSVLGLVNPAFALAAAHIVKQAILVGNFLIVPGFILAFFIPFMPFVYFFFAGVEWVASLLEAVIGMPLWALSFITSEGDLAGEGIEGIKTLLEITLRPTIIVFSLVVAVIIFSASSIFFENALLLYMGVYSDESGVLSLGRNFVVSFAVIFIYVFAVYCLALSSFKLIDAIPQNFGRWLGLSGGYKPEMNANLLGAGAAAAGIFTKASTYAAAGLQGVAGARAGKEEEDNDKKNDKTLAKDVHVKDVDKNDADNTSSTDSGAAPEPMTREKAYGIMGLSFGANKGLVRDTYRSLSTKYRSTTYFSTVNYAESYLDKLDKNIAVHDKEKEKVLKDLDLKADATEADIKKAVEEKYEELAKQVGLGKDAPKEEIEKAVQKVFRAIHQAYERIKQK